MSLLTYRHISFFKFFLKFIFHHTDQHLEEFSCAGSWWWVSWWRPCPDWSWCCGAGAAPEPAGKTPPTPSHGDIAPHLSTSPFSALNSPCARQTRGQPLRGHWVDSLPRHTGEEASLSAECLLRLISCCRWLQQTAIRLPVGHIYINGCLPPCYWSPPERNVAAPWQPLAGWRGMDCSVCWCSAKVKCKTNHGDIYAPGSPNPQRGAW